MLLADGTRLPIAELQAGDLVWTTDPETGESTAQPVLETRASYGDKHLFTITAQTALGEPDTFTATAGHEIWVEGKGWTSVDHLTVGDQLRGATGGILTIQRMHDRGWLSGHTVYNLTVANTHTYYVGTNEQLVHNAASCNFKSDIATGRRVHKEFEALIIKTGGHKATNVGSLGKYKRSYPDALNRDKGPIELKPHNKKALQRGERQLKWYETLTKRTGELWSYRIHGKSTYYKRIR